MSALRYRVRSRSSRISGGGTKLGCKRPCSSNCAIHAQSETSVFRPGTFLMCAALTNSTSKSSSSREYTGFHKTPVLSIATCVQPCSASQYRSARRSSVIVPNVRIVSVRSPAAPGTIRPAATVSLWTSNPQHLASTRSIGLLLLPPAEGASSSKILLCVLIGQQFGVPRSSRAQLVTDSQVPRVSRRRSAAALPNLPHFHPSRVIRRVMATGEKCGLEVSPGGGSEAEPPDKSDWIRQRRRSLSASDPARLSRRTRCYASAGPAGRLSYRS